MIYNLPEDLLTESQCNEDIIIRHYVTKEASNKNKIQLNRVMVNILLSGEKTVLTPELSVSVKKKSTCNVEFWKFNDLRGYSG